MSVVKFERGDTLVEVIVSFAIFAVVAVSVSVLMGRGLSIGQESLELTLVREQISAQAEMIRFARYDTGSSATWDDITSSSRVVGGSIASQNPDDCNSVPSSSAFVLHPNAGSLVARAISPDSYSSSDTSSFVEDNGTAHGMWVQTARAETKPDGVAGYDFYIHACWYTPSSNQPQTLTTAVRLYG